MDVHGSNYSDTLVGTNWADRMYGYNAGYSGTPGDGPYGIWQNGDDWIMTYTPSGNGADYKDIILRNSDNPLGDISFF